VQLNDPVVRSWFSTPKGIFLAVFVLAVAWVCYTDHVWEDYFITYRASKNLAEGNGLTFTVGERVHSFTSPLGVLLPAVAFWIGGGESDRAALWVFRVMGALALAGAITLASLAARRTLPKTSGVIAGGLVAVLLAVDTKILDFATNGMETAYLLLGFAWLIWTMAAQPSRLVLHYGGAWGLLMWSRPDSFIYVAAMGIGALLVGGPNGGWRGRVELCKTLLRGAGVTTLIYLPWLLWAGWYYGTPVPNTVTAKSLFPHDLSWPERFAQTPQMLFENSAVLQATFTPAYAPLLDWPAWGLIASLGLAWIAMLLWVVPRLAWPARVASFMSFVGQCFLTSIIGVGVPWYIPSISFTGLFALAVGAIQFFSWLQNKSRLPVLRGSIWGVGGVAALVLIAGMTYTSVVAARHIKTQQQIVEWGNRKVIGEWLKTNAAGPDDTVFLECLGYIGFYSQLKMYDYPGLGSPEVIAARRLTRSRIFPECWDELIEGLKPDWLVMRPLEVETVRRESPELLDEEYTLAKVFDVRLKPGEIENFMAVWTHGDGYFEVYRRNRTDGEVLDRTLFDQRLTAEDWTEKASPVEIPYDSDRNTLAHAPSRLSRPLPEGAQSLTAEFGLFEGAYERETEGTDGAGFEVWVTTADGKAQQVFARFLIPRTVADDRGRQTLEVDLPAGATNLELRITAGPHEDNAFDWSYWRNVRLKVPLWPDYPPRHLRHRLSGPVD
jgi:hypothetical protein